MFKEMRRKSRQLLKEQTSAILKAGVYGVLSTVGSDGYAYGVPLNYVYENGEICFHCANEGKKLDNIIFNEKVSFCVIQKSEVIAAKFTSNYESAVVFGKASEVTGEEKLNVLRLLIEKYSPDFIEEGTSHIEKYLSVTKVYKIVVQHKSGKANS